MRVLAGVHRADDGRETVRGYLAMPTSFSQLRVSNGVSLIELLVAMAILSLVAAFGYASYSDYVVRTR